MSVNKNPAPRASGKPGHQADFAGAEIKSNNSTVHHTEQSQPSDSSQSRMCKIPLVSGGNAIVSMADWHLVKEYNWWRGGTKNRYAVAPPRGEANSQKSDLLDGEIKIKITLKQGNRQHRQALLPQRIRDLNARLPRAIDDKTHPILFRKWPMDTKIQILRMISHEMEMTGGHHA